VVDQSWPESVKYAVLQKLILSSNRAKAELTDALWNKEFKLVEEKKFEKQYPYNIDSESSGISSTTSEDSESEKLASYFPFYGKDIFFS